jgi:hypothetical protein
MVSVQWFTFSQLFWVLLLCFLSLAIVVFVAFASTDLLSERRISFKAALQGRPRLIWAVKDSFKVCKKVNYYLPFLLP